MLSPCSLRGYRCLVGRSTARMRGPTWERELVYELPSAHALKRIAVAGPAPRDAARLAE